MSAARASSPAAGSQMGQPLCGAPVHQGGEGPAPAAASMHMPVEPSAMAPVEGEKVRDWSGSAALQLAVVTRARAAVEVATRQVGGVCWEVMEAAPMLHHSLSLEPWPQGKVYTTAPGLVSKSSMSMQ